MDNDSPDSVSSIAAQILSYLRRHPEAKDTLEGITEWWLLEQRVSVTKAEVKNALADLLNRGLIVQHEVMGGKTYYSLGKKGTH
jgi:Fe2+ or Zn2+ uptake regulation protein